MPQVNVLQLVQAVRHRLVDLALDSCYVHDKSLRDLCERIWTGDPSTGGLVSPLWVEGAFPAKLPEAGPRNLQELCDAQLFDPDLMKQLDRDEVVPRDRELYAHQIRSVIEARFDSEGLAPARVVTAGTGAGKTECFLLPVLNRLYGTPRPPKAKGVRCIVLYPMNALVNDQVDRLYQWLSGQGDEPRVTLFHFTSETPEDRKGISELFDLCRHNTRQQARGLEQVRNEQLVKVNVDRGEERGPVPDVLVTNYSMLEYMLCRPQDACFFGDALEAIVLDEAHIYTGTLAAEICMLLRRLMQRCGRSSRQILQIATSATLGLETLKEFVAHMFSKPSDMVDVIRGEKRQPDVEVPPGDGPALAQFIPRPWLQTETLEYSTNGRSQLKRESDATRWKSLCEDLGLLAPLPVINDAAHGVDGRLAPLLYKALRRAPLVSRLAKVLSDAERLPLLDIAEQCWGARSLDAAHATQVLLRLAGSAREGTDSYPLIPHRLHVLARAPEGFSVCLNRHCTATDSERHLPLGRVVSGFADTCPDCSTRMLSLFRCAGCGQVLLVGRKVDGEYQPIRPGEMLDRDSRFAGPTALVAFHVDAAGDCSLGSAGELFPANGGASPALRMIPDPFQCPNCKDDLEETARAFVISSALALSVIAETMLAEMPEHPSPHRAYLPARGRRLLCFTDSRQGAARLGPRLTMQHETQMLRRMLALLAPRSSPQLITMLESSINDLQVQLKEATDPFYREELDRELAEKQKRLGIARRGASLDQIRSLVAKNPLSAELLDEATASAHVADAQKLKPAWDANAEAIAAWIPLMVGYELVRPFRGRYIGSLESIGHIEVVFPGLEALSMPPAVGGRISDVAWEELLKVSCDNLRRRGAVTLGSSQLDQEYDMGGARIGKYCTRSQLVGSEDRNRLRELAGKLLKASGVAQADLAVRTDELLGAVWDTLHGSGLPWVTSDKNAADPAIRIDFKQLAFRRPERLFYSPRTGHVFSHAVPVANAPAATDDLGCDDLVLVSHEQADQLPRLRRPRREYTEAANTILGMGLWAEEHTAQLSPQENRRLQDLFKLGFRNVLSSSTTLELGIDIGGLTGVFLTDVPPGKANYLQRAGRAGRRADGSSIVATFARAKPFDRATFDDFGEYLGQPLRNPTVILERPKLVRRHLFAALFGEFFREFYGPNQRAGAMQAYRTIGDFVGVRRTSKWLKDEFRPPLIAATPNSILAQFHTFLEQRRQPMLDMLDRLVQGLPANVADVTATMDEAAAELDVRVSAWQKDYDQLVDQWLLPDAQEDSASGRRLSNSIHYRALALYKVTTIEALADRQYLPRYGFPIGVQRLSVYRLDTDQDTGAREVRQEDQYRLERPGLQAMREYAPGSSIVVGGRVVKSRGLMRDWLGTDAAALANLGIEGAGAYCTNSHFIYWRDGKQRKQCEVPGCNAPIARTISLLFPRSGFSTAASEPPKRSTQVEQVGELQVQTTEFTHLEHVERIPGFAGVLGLVLSLCEGGTLLVYNQGRFNNSAACGFAVCPACGYADAERQFGAVGQQQLPTGFRDHVPLRRFTRGACMSNGSPVLRNRYLASEETTDLVFLQSPGFVSWTPIQLETLGAALRLGGARLLNLDSRELGFTVVPGGIVFYDNHPGGAGHVIELSRHGREWLTVSREKVLFIEEKHHLACEHGCLRCILTFDSMGQDSDRPYERRFAHEWLKSQLTAPVGGANPAAADHALQQFLKQVPEQPATLRRFVAKVKTELPAIDYAQATGSGEFVMATLAWPKQKVVVLAGDDAAWQEGWKALGWHVSVADDTTDWQTAALDVLEKGSK